jgi:hypothetical protein
MMSGKCIPHLTTASVSRSCVLQGDKLIRVAYDSDGPEVVRLGFIAAIMLHVVEFQQFAAPVNRFPREFAHSALYRLF